MYAQVLLQGLLGGSSDHIISERIDKLVSQTVPFLRNKRWNVGCKLNVLCRQECCKSDVTGGVRKLINGKSSVFTTFSSMTEQSQFETDHRIFFFLLLRVPN